MTQATSNKTIFERQEEIDYEWKDGDDAEIYDAGYQDGLIKAITILDSVRQQPEVDRLPSSFTVSVVIATLRKVAEGED